jgi:RimJ/RimL family protein N-acetyltransferase
MRLDETRLMIRYFLEADHDLLRGMGIDPKKLPSESTWRELLQEDFTRPIPQRHFYFRAWVFDGALVGHCNLNKIAYGQSAFLHLHVWNVDNRRDGCATQLLKPSVVHFFERFELRELFCEPYALNPAPNRALPKVGFQLVKPYETTPGWINFHQPVNLWMLARETALNLSAPPNRQDIN